MPGGGEGAGRSQTAGGGRPGAPGRGKGKGGTGGAGRGKGGKVPEGKDEGGGFSDTRLKAKFDPRGRILASRYFLGLPRKGEVAAAYRKVMRIYGETARDALSREEIPLEYRACVKEYFDSINPKENE